MASITITIPNDKVAEFKAGFLVICPVPMKNVATSPGPPDMQPEMSEVAWIKKVARYGLMDKYRQGKVLLAKQTVEIDEGVIDT